MGDAFYEKLYLELIDGQDMNNPEVRAQLIAERLSFSNYDLTVLEELLDADLRSIVLKKLKKVGYYHSELLGSDYYRNWSYLYNGGVMVFSRYPIFGRYPIIEGDELVLSAAGEQGVAAIGVKYIKLMPVHGRTVHVFAVHLQTIQHGWEEEHIRLRRHIDKLKTYKNGKNTLKEDIVVGDFNANAGNKADQSEVQLSESFPHKDFLYLCDQLSAKEVRPFKKSTFLI